MSMGSARSRGETARGSILIEALVALVLVSLLLGPLSAGMQTARERAQAARAVFSAPAPAGDATVGAAWSWGPRVASGRWLAGQRLELDIVSEAAGDPIVGLWADGWFIAEFDPGENGLVLAKVGFLGVPEGAEVVARVRLDGGAWGPPWRSLVPPPAGLADPVFAAVTSDAADGTGDLSMVIHPLCLANPLLATSDPAGRLRCAAPGVPMLVSFPPEGEFLVDLAGRRQSVRMEGRRALDMYF